MSNLGGVFAIVLSPYHILHIADFKYKTSSDIFHNAYRIWEFGFRLKSLVEVEVIHCVNVLLWLNVGMFSYIISVIGGYHSDSEIYDF